MVAPSGSSVATRKAAINRARRLRTASVADPERARLERSARRFAGAATAQRIDQRAQRERRLAFVGRWLILHTILEPHEEGQGARKASERRQRQRHAFQAPGLGVARGKMRDRTRRGSHARDGVALLPQVEAQNERLPVLGDAAAGRLVEDRHLEIHAYRPAILQVIGHHAFDEAQPGAAHLQHVSRGTYRQGLCRDRGCGGRDDERYQRAVDGARHPPRQNRTPIMNVARVVGAFSGKATVMNELSVWKPKPVEERRLRVPASSHTEPASRKSAAPWSRY